MSNSQTRSENGTSTVWQIVGRLIAAAVVLGITAFFTPGFSINNIWTLIIAAVVLTVIDYLVTKFTGLHASPFGKGFVGFALLLCVVSMFFIYIQLYLVSIYIFGLAMVLLIISYQEIKLCSNV